MAKFDKHERENKIKEWLKAAEDSETIILSAAHDTHDGKAQLQILIIGDPGELLQLEEQVEEHLYEQVKGKMKEMLTDFLKHLRDN